MKTSDFYYELPEELIAQTPIEKRDHSRMLVYNIPKKTIEHKHFFDIIDYLSPNDVLVINKSKVIPARIYGSREGKNEVLETLLLKKLELNTYECLVKPGKKFKVGTIIRYSDNLLGEVKSINETGERVIAFKVLSGDTLEAELDRIGEMPLPPYIKEKLKKKDRYQTVYAKIDGSSAAPTAGLHFTPELLEKIKNKGVQIEEVVLHVGLGTFRPVKVEDVENHIMHSEEYYVDSDTAERLNKAKQDGKRIIAVGTTSVRTLESVSDDNGTIKAGSGTTSIFIYPPYRFKFVDSLVTNFHLPESTLLMLVSSLIGKDELFRCYESAIKERYRFFSFGDCMFIDSKGD
ncbi:MAG: tRNA preQ1(34) S-adenosylmethionine ribosyltransferase-isomerase QueA [Clostridia bacterium]|nr:tRNA preQ1(34) S-adenosylmethionine ribosyltransferase-isomerase QueA [Clostridia bacterium]